MSTGNKSIMPINWQECREAEEAKKRACEAEEAEKRVHEAEVQHQEAAVVERQREAEWQEAKRAKEVKKQQHTKSKARPSGTKRKMACDWCLHNKEKCGGQEDGFQSVDTLVDKVQIFGAEGFLSKPVLESEPTEDELQETLREVKELQEEHLEWAMECLQMRKEWMQQEEATLTKHLKGKGKELAKESEQEEEQGTGDEEKEGEAE
ncbi:hypothetical protein ID866_10354 [Astraeus odoratus]|nr:hypothetical protein ID866_10354 [Astraeus odoratus]